jgi:hypothetical protein
MRTSADLKIAGLPLKIQIYSPFFWIYSRVVDEYIRRLLNIFKFLLIISNISDFYLKIFMALVGYEQIVITNSP